MEETQVNCETISFLFTIFFPGICSFNDPPEKMLFMGRSRPAQSEDNIRPGNFTFLLSPLFVLCPGPVAAPASSSERFGTNRNRAKCRIHICERLLNL